MEGYRSLAIASAHQATEAAAELLRFAREGEAADLPFATEVVAQLADALKLAIEIETESWPKSVASGYVAGRNQLLGATVRFLEDWSD